MSRLLSCPFLMGALGIAALLPRKFLCGSGRAQGMGTGRTRPQMRHRGGLGAVPALPRALESIREQFGLEIAGRERSRAGQTSNNADTSGDSSGTELCGHRELPEPAAAGATPGSSRLSSFLLPPRVFQGLLKE